MSESEAEATFIYTLLGREVMFQKTTPGMMMALRRYVMRLRDQMAKETDEDRIMEGFHKINAAYMDLIDSRFCDPADRDWVEKMMMTGKIEDKDLHPIMSNGEATPEPAPDDADPAPAKKAPKKPSLKQPAKKAIKKPGAIPLTTEAARGSVKR